MLARTLADTNDIHFELLKILMPFWIGSLASSFNETLVTGLTNCYSGTVSKGMLRTRFYQLKANQIHVFVMQSYEQCVRYLIQLQLTRIRRLT